MTDEDEDEAPLGCTAALPGDTVRSFGTAPSPAFLLGARAVSLLLRALS